MASRLLSFAAGKNAFTTMANSSHTLLAAFEGKFGSPASMLHFSRLFHNNIFTSPSPISPSRRLITAQSSPGSPSPSLLKPSSTGNSSFLVTPTPDISSNNWCVGSCYGWLAYMSRQDCSLFFKSYHGDYAISMPSIEMHPYIVEVVRDRGRIIGFKTRNRISDPFRKTDIETPSYLARYLIKDLAISSPPQFKNSIAMAIYGESRQLAFCELGPLSSSWIDLSEMEIDYLALGYSNKNRLFYTSKKAGCSTEIEAWDLNNPSSPKRVLNLPDYLVGSATHIIDLRNMNKVYLVECFGEMLYVLRYCAFVNEEFDGTLAPIDAIMEDGYPYKTLKFEVYKMVNGGFEYVDSLEDRALFLGKNQSFAASARDYPGLIRDSIYFTDDEWAGTVYIESEDGGSVEYGYGGHDCGVYNMRDLTVTPFMKLNRIWPASIWVSNFSNQ